MIDPASSSGDGRRRGKKNRGGAKQHGRRKRASKPRGNRGSSQSPQNQDWYNADAKRDDSSILGGRTMKPRERKPALPHTNGGPPDAFTLFCAYHLGITEDDGYHEPRPDDVARRFGMTPDELQQLLRTHELDVDAIRRSDFDLAGAQLDIRLAPEGISRTESARDLFAELMDSRSAS